MQKQLQEMHEQIEQTVVEMKTFENLRQHEVIAVPKRVEVCNIISMIVAHSLDYKAGSTYREHDSLLAASPLSIS